jgi:hypothetical protein
MTSNVPSSGKRQARKDHIECAVEGYKNKASKRAHLKKKLAIMDANVRKPSAPPPPPTASVAGISFFHELFLSHQISACSTASNTD